MKNADSLIQRYERDKIEEDARIREWRIKNKKERKIKQQKNESILNDVFGEPR